MNDAAMLALGKIVYGLAIRTNFVRVGTVESVLSKGLFTIKATRVINGKTYEVTEMVSEISLEQISDPAVIVDALIEKMQLPKVGR